MVADEIGIAQLSTGLFGRRRRPLMIRGGC
jgi:hypothetical protein